MSGKEIHKWIQWNRKTPNLWGKRGPMMMLGGWERSNQWESAGGREKQRERERPGERERERERYRSTAWMITNFNTNNDISDPPVKFVIHPPNQLPVQHSPVNTIVNIDTATSIATFWDAKIANNAHDCYSNEWYNNASGNKRILEVAKWRNATTKSRNILENFWIWDKWQSKVLGRSRAKFEWSCTGSFDINHWRLWIKVQGFWPHFDRKVLPFLNIGTFVSI